VPRCVTPAFAQFFFRCKKKVDAATRFFWHNVSMAVHDPNDKLLDYLIQRVEKMDEKIDTLLRFKWQIIGASLGLSIVVTTIMQVVAIFFGSK
jgi:hypothetical protein